MTSITFTSSDGRVWESNDALMSGDYLPGGALARSNKRVILEEIKAEGGDYCDLPCSWSEAEAGQADIDCEVQAVFLRESYSSEIMFLEAESEHLAALSDYCCASEDDLSELEHEEQAEAWTDWARSDLLRGVTWDCLGFDEEDDDDRPADLEHWADDPADWLEHHFSTKIEEMFHAACDTSNTYWQQDGDAQWIDLDRVRPEFIRIVNEELALEPRLALEAAGQMALALDLPQARTLERYS